MAFVRHTTNNINSLTPLRPYGLIRINTFIHVAFSLKAFGTVNHKMLSKILALECYTVNSRVNKVD